MIYQNYSEQYIMIYTYILLYGTIKNHISSKWDVQKQAIIKLIKIMIRDTICQNMCNMINIYNNLKHCQI